MSDASNFKLLLSSYAERTWGARIAAGLPPGCATFITAEAASVAGSDCPADIAFLTREVTGRSSKNHDTPELTAFQAVLRRSPRLRWLHIHPAGADRAIYTELRARGVKVTTSSGATATTVSHTAIGAVLALARRMPALLDAQRRHAWEPLLGNPPRDLGGQTAVIVGLGPIGRKIAVLLRALGVSSIGVRRTAEPVSECDRTISYAEFPNALPQAHWLILCCPLSPLTRGIAGAASFARMPRGAYLVNVSRGDVAIERDVIAALSSGQLGGAYLDVFEREPLDPASPLWDMPNAMISPHTASHSQGLTEFVLEIFLDNLARWRSGGKLRNDLDDLARE